MAKEEALSYIDYIKSKSTHTEDDPTLHDDHIHQPEDLKEDSESKVVIDFQDLDQSQSKSTAVAPKISTKVKVSAEYNIYFSMWFGAAK